MRVIVNNKLRDSVYGTVYRVCVGALVSTVDAATDVYVISTYYGSPELIEQANTLFIMISLNLFFQLTFVFIQYKKKA